MRYLTGILGCAAGCLLAACSIVSAADPAGGFDFNRNNRLILSGKCFPCRGSDSAHCEAGLRLDVGEAAKQWAIDTEDLAESEVLARIESEKLTW